MKLSPFKLDIDGGNLISDKGILEVMFNTNATLLTEKKSRQLINAGIDKISCSIDGYTKEFYEKIKPVKVDYIDTPMGAGFDISSNIPKPESTCGSSCSSC